MTQKKPLIFTPQKEFEVWKWLIFLKSKLEMNFRVWENAARLEGSAYHEAYTNFSSVLSKRDDECKLEDQIVYGCITAFTVGMLGSIGEKALGLLWANIEDTLQTAVGEAIDYHQMKPKIEISNKVVEKHPFLFQNSLLIKLNDQWIKVMKHFVDVEEELLKIDSTKRDSLKKFEEIDEKVKKKWMSDKKYEIKLMTDPQEINFKWLSKEFEMFMWAKWIRTFIATHVPTPQPQPETDRHIEGRLIALGIAKKCDIEIDWTDHTFYNQFLNRPTNDSKLCVWARDYIEEAKGKQYYL